MNDAIQSILTQYLESNKIEDVSSIDVKYADDHNGIYTIYFKLKGDTVRLKAIRLDRNWKLIDM